MPTVNCENSSPSFDFADHAPDRGEVVLQADRGAEGTVVDVAVGVVALGPDVDVVGDQVAHADGNADVVAVVASLPERLRPRSRC